MGRPRRTTWTIAELRQDLAQFEEVLADAKLKPSTVDTYVSCSGTFLRWLDGKYEPTGPAAKPSATPAERSHPQNPAKFI